MPLLAAVLAAVLVLMFALNAQAGVFQLDFSTNKPTVPNIGSNFGGSGPYANYVLIATVPATQRKKIEVVNESAAQITIVLDDGTAPALTPPVNSTVFSLAGSSASGTRGDAWWSPHFVGRVQVFAPAGSAFVGIHQE